ncbi:MAG TPA: hypothetical protein VL051_12715 [Burkholderiaceae bacterium]|nr:hypothetical protein [Burkholderiaceae bacterium]
MFLLDEMADDGRRICSTIDCGIAERLTLARLWKRLDRVTGLHARSVESQKKIQ